MSQVSTFSHALLDGAHGDSIAISKESAELSRFVRDPDKTLVDRLEAYEDITSLEVGDTMLIRARTLERETGLRQLYLKFEGGNPSGTQKDRIAFAQCHDALRRGYHTVTLATCGNYGASMALAAQLAGLTCRIYIPEAYRTLRVSEMEKNGAEVKRIKGSYEHCVIRSSALARQHDWYDANPGAGNTPLQMAAYAQIADELYDQLRDGPRLVAAPVSNGTLLAGIYRGFVRLNKRGKTSRVPRMVAASSYRKNPIVHAYRKGLKRCVDLDERAITESATNEPLINWHSFDGDDALYAVYESGGFAGDISDEKMNAMAAHLRRQEGLNVLPASTAGLVALLEHHAATPLEADRYVAVITGKK